MTRTEFNAANKVNHGSPMASDTRARYRAEMHRGEGSVDFLVRRRAKTRDGLHVLAIGSKFRSVADWRKATGRALLG